MKKLNRELRHWERIYNTVRPHQSLGYLTPHQFLRQNLIPTKGMKSVTHLLDEYIGLRFIPTGLQLHPEGFMLRLNLRVLASTILACLSLAPVCAIAQRGGGGVGHVAPPSSVPLPSNVDPRPTFMTGTTTARAENEGRVEFRSDVVLVQFPVIVTDKSGQHIHNLKKEDFEALESGKEQKITAFEEVTANRTPLPAVKTADGEFRISATATGEQPRSIGRSWFWIQ